MTEISLKEKARIFRDLHHSGDLLVLPNIWDPLGAALLEDIGFPAVATASASVAYSNGYNDGEEIPFDDLLRILSGISKAVNIPVTADIETGYAHTVEQLESNINKLINAGIVGINIEDFDKENNGLFSIEIQAEKISSIRKIAEANNIHFFINARTDTFIKQDLFNSPVEKLAEAIRRGIAYRNAGADCFYPIAICELDDIKQLISEINMPINILMMPGIPGFEQLRQLGVSRISLGPGFLKWSIHALKAVAADLLQQKGMDTILSNEITSVYLKKLVNK